MEFVILGVIGDIIKIDPQALVTEVGQAQGGMMDASHWTFANLNDEQLELIKEGESTLGADYLLAYQQDEKAHPGYVEMFVQELSAAPLDGSQIECLVGLEHRLHTVLVAYTSPAL